MWPTLIPVIANVLDKLLPDPTAAADAKIKLIEIAQNGELQALNADVQLATGQMEINKAEAASGNWFASSWRPAVGYCCVLGLFYNYLLYPLLLWGCALWAPAIVPPVLNTDNLMELVFGMLGMAGLRTYEKVRSKG